MVDWQTHIYGKASHAFVTPSAQDEAAGIIYEPSSAIRAWEAVENFLKEVFSVS